MVKFNRFEIKHCDITVKEDRYNAVFEGVDGDVVKFDFYVARVQNVKPMVFNDICGYYEVNDRCYW